MNYSCIVRYYSLRWAHSLRIEKKAFVIVMLTGRGWEFSLDDFFFNYKFGLEVGRGITGKLFFLQFNANLIFKKFRLYWDIIDQWNYNIFKVHIVVIWFIYTSVPPYLWKTDSRTPTDRKIWRFWSPLYKMM